MFLFYKPDLLDYSEWRKLYVKFEEACKKEKITKEGFEDIILLDKLIAEYNKYNSKNISHLFRQKKIVDEIYEKLQKIFLIRHYPEMLLSQLKELEKLSSHRKETLRNNVNKIITDENAKLVRLFHKNLNEIELKKLLTTDAANHFPEIPLYALELSIRRQCPKAIPIILSTSAVTLDSKIKDEYNNELTPLELTCRLQSLEILRELFRHGISMTVAFSTACKVSSADFVNNLLKEGAKPIQADASRFESPLVNVVRVLLSAKNPDYSILNILLQSGAFDYKNILDSTKAEYTSLVLIIDKDRMDIFRRLFTIIPDKEKITGANQILKNFSCHMNIAEYLVHNGADIDLIKLHVVAQSTFLTESFLKKHDKEKFINIEPLQVKHILRFLPLYSESFSQPSTYLENSIKILIRAHSGINIPDEHGQTILHFTSEKNLRNQVTLLVENGADIFKRNKYGKTAIDFFGDAPEFYNHLLQLHRKEMEKRLTNTIIALTQATSRSSHSLFKLLPQEIKEKILSYVATEVPGYAQTELEKKIVATTTSVLNISNFKEQVRIILEHNEPDSSSQLNRLPMECITTLILHVGFNYGQVPTRTPSDIRKLIDLTYKDKMDYPPEELKDENENQERMNL